jgi:hypothetical protein
VIASAGDYKISGKNGIPVLSSLYGSKRKGIGLVQSDTEDMVFEYDLPASSSVTDKGKIAFQEDDSGKVSSLCIGLYRLEKKKFHETYRFKIYLIVGFIVCFIMVFLIFDILSGLT